ncbi:hypothetical protein Tco_0003812 [Tanacetum coccineum]
MLTTEELLLKSKSQSLPVDSLSSSPMVLIAETGTNRRPSNPQVKSWRPCYNFAKDMCRFGDSCITGSGSNTFAHSNVTGGMTVSLVQNTTPVAYYTNPTGLTPPGPPHYTVGTLHDPAIGAWNMDIGALSP